jgi:hypothetical protein
MVRLILLLAISVPPRQVPNCPNGQCNVIAQPILVQAPVIAPQVIPAPPVVQPLPLEAQFFFGVEEGLRPNRDRYMLGDREISPRAVHAFFEDASADVIPEDAIKPHLTLVAKDLDGYHRLKKMLDNDALLPVRERYRCQVYSLDQTVDVAMCEGFKLADNSEFQKSGHAVIVQPHSESGTAKVEAVGFGLTDALALLAWLRSRDPLLPRPLSPSPSPEPPLPGSAGGASAVIVLTLLAALLMVSILVGTNSSQKG